ncbi:superoxide dismutase [Halalkalibacillus sediminis]|uniref:Superoxide dismutase [Cu-Zn] n=2 Tax=Halalkalibacillus sediminis TaxID=2018042 RepID=A0A2I0QV19_9BACI|nr:superoxide dismutase [Halalkalibacillus sediminis]
MTACQADAATVYEVDIKNRDSDVIGKAKFQEDAGGVTVEVNVAGLTPGFHGIHLHEFPKCEPPTFESAGSHWTNDDSKHGLMHPDGHHIGDMPNIEVGGDGTATFEYLIADATLKDGKGSIFSDGGKALIIHEKIDDGVSQPSGDAGERMACGVIQKDSKSTTEDASNPGDQVEDAEEEK